jgi:hypothetical protein
MTIETRRCTCMEVLEITARKRTKVSKTSLGHDKIVTDHLYKPNQEDEFTAVFRKCGYIIFEA